MHPGKLTALKLEHIYDRYNRKKYVKKDPIAFLNAYGDARDREVAGLIASSLAYGRVAQILNSVEAVLALIGPPAECACKSKKRDLKKMLAHMRHRFTSGEEIGAMIFGAGKVIKRHGSLGAYFALHVSDDDENVLPALTAFAQEIRRASGQACPSLIPDPSRGSACKKLNLYVRWMVRKDAVDPGGWQGVPSSKLIVPLDTHMHRVGLRYGLTSRKSADMRTALEITRAFRKFAPDDPVKYDFALTRPGILGL